MQHKQTCNSRNGKSKKTSTTSKRLLFREIVKAGSSRSSEWLSNNHSP
ncbi:hypothetical protein [Cohnella cellulosilytica]